MSFPQLCGHTGKIEMYVLTLALWSVPCMPKRGVYRRICRIDFGDAPKQINATTEFEEANNTQRNQRAAIWNHAQAKQMNN